MAKDELKTKATELSVADFIAALPDARRRDEASELDALFRRVTGCEPKLWGPSVIGYGSYHYKYESGREGTSCRAGFSPRKAALTLYAMGDAGRNSDGAAAFEKLGKHTTGKGCLYIRKLADVDPAILEQLVAMSWEQMNAAYPA